MTQYKCSKCGVVLTCKPTCHENLVNGEYVRCSGKFHQIGTTSQIQKLKERIGDWMEWKIKEDRRSGW